MYVRWSRRGLAVQMVDFYGRTGQLTGGGHTAESAPYATGHYKSTKKHGSATSPSNRSGHLFFGVIS